MSELSRDLLVDTLPGAGLSRVPGGSGEGRVTALLEEAALLGSSGLADTDLKCTYVAWGFRGGNPAL